MTMTIVVCTDFTAAAAAGEREAARRFPDDLLVICHATDEKLVRHVVEITGGDGAALREQMIDFADQRLNEIVGRLTSEGRRAVAELACGDPVEKVLEIAARHDAKLIVLGVPAEDPAASFRTVLMRRTRVPVLLIPAPEA